MFWLFRRRPAEDHFLPPLSPLVKLKPPRGFRFASDLPSLNDLIHLDNDRPYRNVKRGERLLIFDGVFRREPAGEGVVIARMDAGDRRANAANCPPDMRGILFKDETGKVQWRPSDLLLTFWRREDGVLQYTR